MSAPHTARAAQPRDAEGDPQNFERLAGAFGDKTNTTPSELFQEEQIEAINPFSLGVGLNACQKALNELGWPAPLTPIWEVLRALGIRDDRSSGRFMDALHVADVNHCEGGRFDFAAETALLLGTVAAIVFPVFDEFGETIDVAAWHPKSGALDLWCGAACLLGEQNISAPRIEHDGVRVHPSALAWLRAGRTGVYVVDPERARWRLAGETLVVDDVAFGRRLRDALRLPEPQIFVTTADARRAA
jgi:hypothetical protein